MSEKKKILLVEDDYDLCEEMKQFFAEDNQLSLAHIVHDGEEALAHIQDVDAVVLDLIIPQVDGISVLERVAQLPAAARPEMIVVSSFASDRVISTTMDLGARYFLRKPYSLVNLRRRILEVLEEDSRGLHVGQSISPLPSSRSIDEKITSVFLTVGIPAHIKGYHFLRYAIKLVMEDSTMINRITKELYPKVAEHFETTPSKVERAIRHAIEVAWTRGKIENINQLFGYQVYTKNEKQTNGEFIALVADKLSLEQSA